MPHRHLDLALLQALEVLLEERSVSRGARRLGLSQPAMSAKLRKLRAIFEDDLLVPSGGRLSLTSRAQTLADPVRRLIGDFAEVLHRGQPFDPASSTRGFTIALTDYCHAVAAASLMAAISVRAPNVQTTMMSLDKRHIGEAMASGAVDLILAGDWATSQSLIAVNLWRDPLVLAQRKGHPRGDQPLDLEAFCGLRHACTRFFQNESRTLVDEELARLGRARRVAAYLPSYDVTVRTLLATDLVAELPVSFAARASADLNCFKLPLAVPAYLAKAVWHQRSQADPGHQWLRHLVAEVSRGIDVALGPADERLRGSAA